MNKYKIIDSQGKDYWINADKYEIRNSEEFNVTLRSSEIRGIPTSTRFYVEVKYGKKMQYSRYELVASFGDVIVIKQDGNTDTKA